MADANALNIPSIGPISNTSAGTFSSSYNKFYQPGWANIGISQSAGTTFTVLSEAGTAFSSTNPGFVALQSKTAGQIKRYSVTANQSFTQAQLGNNLFGITTAVNWAQDVPFYLYAVCDDTESSIAFMISRVPQRIVSPAAANIAQSGNTNATTQGSFFSLSAITAADYEANPCICLGSFRMQYTGGGTDLWTIQTLANNDGVGKFNDTTIFTYPISQNGAAASTYFLANGGTAPIFTTNTAVYTIGRDGLVTYLYNGETISTNGVGAVTFRPVIPLAYLDMSAKYDCGIFANAAGTQCVIYLLNPTSAGLSLQNMRIWNNAENGTVMTNAGFTGSVNLRFQFGYIATTA